MASRPRRNRGNKRRAEALAAVERLQQARENGRSLALADSGDESDDAIYDNLTEEQYHDLVRQRRKQESFVVDDDGTGYYDDGEEHLFVEPEDPSSQRGPRVRSRGGAAPGDDGRDPKKGKSRGALSLSALARARDKHRERLGSGKGNKKIGAMILGMGKSRKTSMRPPTSRLAGAAASSTASGAAAAATSAANPGDFDLDSALDDLLGGAAAPSASLASLSRAVNRKPLKTPTIGMKRRAAQAGLSGDLLDSPSGSVPKVHRAEGQASASSSAPSAAVTATAEITQDATNVDGQDDGADAAMDMDVDDDSTAPADAAANVPAVAEAEQAAQANPAAGSVSSRNSKFLEMQRQRRERKRLQQEKERQVAEAAAAAAAEVAAAAAQAGAAVSTTSGSGGWWDMSNADSKDEVTGTEDMASAPTSAVTSHEALENLMVECKDEDGDTYKCLRMYYLDAEEKNGRIYMFGKVAVGPNEYKSICIQVDGLERQLYFLPRQTSNADSPPDLMAMYEEVQNLLLRGVLRGARNQFRCKPVKRNYAFEKPGVPRESSWYLKCKYSAEFPNIERCSGTHFSHVFGTGVSLLENFLVKRRLRGPCWVEVREVKSGRGASWCKFEGKIDDPKQITVPSSQLPPPPVTIMSLAVKTYVNKQDMHEIAMVSAIVHQNVQVDKPTPKELQRDQLDHFTLVRSLAGVGAPGHLSREVGQQLNKEAQQRGTKLKVIPGGERGMLNLLLAKIGAHDPDMLVGHNISGHDLEVLMTRCAKLKCGKWSKLGRLNLSKIPRAYRTGGRNYERLAVGRLIVDTYSTARELVRGQANYSMKALASKFCDAERIEVQPLDVPNYYASAGHIVHLQRHNENGCFLALKLMFKLEMLPITKQLSNLAGNLWSGTLGGGRAERIAYLLVHEFHRRKYIVPDKERRKKKSGGRRGPSKYAGGLVLEPKKGLYDRFVLLLDFNSLYPSIIQEYNICFTTVERQLEGEQAITGQTEQEQKASGGDGMSEFQIPELPPAAKSDDDWAVLPTLLRTLIERRKVVKDALKRETDPVKQSLLNNKQLALKLTANSMYGCLGFSHSRFYAAPIAALVTKTGREILENTCRLAEGMGLDVIYGDTDSIMIHTNLTDLDKVNEIGRKVMREVNKLYKLLEIDIDGVYKSMLLLKKKKYAAIMVKNRPDGTMSLVKETKGLDLVRRDWCQLSKDVGHFALDAILSGQDTEEVVDSIHEHLRATAAAMKAGEVPLEKYQVIKGLSKAPKEYGNAKSMPHVKVALDMVAAGRPVNVGDHIPYVVCKEPAGDASYAMRAHHPDRVRAARRRAEEKNEKCMLNIDIEWYLSQQILPPTDRLCDPIEGTSKSIIAEHLGLDPKIYSGGNLSMAGGQGPEDLVNYVPSTQLPYEERYKDATPLVVLCPKCSTESTFQGIFRFEDAPAAETGPSRQVFAGSKCPNPGCTHSYDVAHLQNVIDMAVRRHTMQYYKGEMQCTDSTCCTKTRQQGARGNACIYPQCQSTSRELVSAGALYTQLKYYHSLFDMQHWRGVLKEKMGATDETKYLSATQIEEFKKLEQRVLAHLDRNDYQWISPTLFSNVFSSKRVTA